MAIAEAEVDTIFQSIHLARTQTLTRGRLNRSKLGLDALSLLRRQDRFLYASERIAPKSHSDERSRNRCNDIDHLHWTISQHFRTAAICSDISRQVPTLLVRDAFLFLHCIDYLASPTSLRSTPSRSRKLLIFFRTSGATRGRPLDCVPSSLSLCCTRHGAIGARWPGSDGDSSAQPVRLASGRTGSGSSSFGRFAPFAAVQLEACATVRSLNSLKWAPAHHWPDVLSSTPTPRSTRLVTGALS